MEAWIATIVKKIKIRALNWLFFLFSMDYLYVIQYI